jgi:hypothetical protein
MQLMIFSTGGFVLHKVYINGVKHSAWYNDAADLIDAAYYPRSGGEYSLKRNGPRWRQLAAIGKVNKPTRAEKSVGKLWLNAMKGK